MSEPSAALFVMRQDGHFQTLRPLISGLVNRGITSHVFTHRDFAPDVERAGGHFVDLFERYPLDAADAESFPMPSRFVSFAGHYAERILDDLAKIRPSLVVYDEHAVIGRVAGEALGVPYVHVSPGHNVHAGRLELLLNTIPPAHISESCKRAVATLREQFGIRDASPFSFATGRSPQLNVYCEPPAYLTEAERGAFEPVVFHGCLPAIAEIKARRARADPHYFGQGSEALMVYVCFGTVVWRYWPGEALDALAAISEAIGRRPDVRAVISLGGAELADEMAGALSRPNVTVTGYVDQWKILQEADVFFTHHGARSTHEAAFHGVPMISSPFFWDQPALAERCRQLGLAVPLTSSTRDPVSVDDVNAALASVTDAGETMRGALAQAGAWELDVIAGRDSVLDRITDLV